MGSGFLTLPWAFYQVGLIVGIGTLLFTCAVALLSVLFVLESISRGQLLFSLRSKNYHLLKPDSNDVNESLSLAQNKSYICTDFKMEIPEICELFIGKSGKRLYTLCLAVYLYSSLWLYCSVFANAFSNHFPIITPYDNTDDYKADNYYLYLFLFGLVVVPTSCLELKEQVYFQVMLTCVRFLMVTCMVITVLVAYCTKSNDFHLEKFDPSSIEDNMNFIIHHSRISNLHLILPLAMFAGIFHHSIPALIEPIKRKQDSHYIFSTALLCCYSLYALAAVVTCCYFGKEVQSSSNLMWNLYSRSTVVTKSEGGDHGEVRVT